MKTALAYRRPRAGGRLDCLATGAAAGFSAFSALAGLAFGAGLGAVAASAIFNLNEIGKLVSQLTEERLIDMQYSL